jgi:hypothetical protein
MYTWKSVLLGLLKMAMAVGAGLVCWALVWLLVMKLGAL